MQNIHVLRQREKKLAAENRAMLDAAANDGGRDLTESEAAKYDDNVKALVGLDKQIEREAAQMERERNMPVVPDGNASAAAAGSPDKKAFKSLGEQMVAIVRAERSGGRADIDPRLIQASASGANETIPSEGGFLVQTDFTTEILQKAYSLGSIAGKVRRIPVAGNGLKINAIDETSRANGSRYGGIQAYWINEADAFTGTKPAFRQMELNLKKLTGLCYATDELLADASALESVLSDAFPQELNFKVEDAIINGSGAGQPLGIMNAGGLVTVTKETSQVAATLVAENVIKMFARIPPRSQANAEWYVNVDVLPQLPQLNIKIKNVAGSENVGGISTPIYQFPSGGNGYGTILGRPVVPVEYCQTLGTLGDILLADLSQYLLIDKGGVQSASSMHVRFLYDEMTFRFVYRVDGQPIWNSALTPFKGSNTLSPYVTLQAR